MYKYKCAQFTGNIVFTSQPAIAHVENILVKCIQGDLLLTRFLSEKGSQDQPGSL